MKKKIEFSDKQVIDGKEYVSRLELDRNYDLTKTGRMTEVDESGKQRRIPGAKWTRMFRMRWEAILLIFVVVFSFFMYTASIAEYKDIATNPCNFCSGVLSNGFVFNGSMFSNNSIDNITVFGGESIGGRGQ